MNCKIIKDDEIIEIPYYQLERTCKRIVECYINDTKISDEERLHRQKEFLEFRQPYDSFSPYFDYVFTRLDYILENPFMIPNTILKPVLKDNTIYYYAIFKDMKEMSKDVFLFVDGKEENIQKEVIDSNFDNLHKCFFDEYGNMATIKGMREEHNFWARPWIHDLMMKSESFCLDYCTIIEFEKNFISHDLGALIIRYKGWIQHTIYFDDGKKSMVRYSSDCLSESQSKLIEALKAKNILLDGFMFDMDEESLIHK